MIPITEITFTIPAPNGEDPYEPRGRHALYEVRNARFSKQLDTPGWLAVVESIQELVDGGVSVTLDVTALGQPLEDQRAQAKAALEAYGDMLNAHEQERFRSVRDAPEAPEAVCGPPDAVAKRLRALYQALVPPNGRKVERSNIAEYAKNLDGNTDPEYWTDYVELTDLELAAEAAEEAA